MIEPAQVEWPSEWENWGRYSGYESPILMGDPIYHDCDFQCQRGWLLAPDGSASKCPHCLD